MKQWNGFFKKELAESIKTYKLLLIVMIFSILGVLNPFTAKITPVLMEKLLPADAALSLPEPAALDSWLQFYKNMPQMGLIVFILLFGTMMSKELEKGTLVILLAKGLRRSTVITAKFANALCHWTLAVLLSFAVTYAYTAFYWDQSGLHSLFFAALCFYVFGMLLLSITLFGNTVFAVSYGGVLTVLAAVITLFTAALFPNSSQWNPLELINTASELLTGETAPADLLVPFAVSISAAAVFVGSAVIHFKKKLI